jgi:DNA adenine methylase
MALTPPLKWHGGKAYLATRIVELMPQHLHYAEPFFGGGSVLFARDPDVDSQSMFADQGVSEVVNDLNHRLTNFWRVLQDEDKFAKFYRIIESMPLSRLEWQDAHARIDTGDAVQDAIAFFVNCRQSLAGRQDSFTGLTRTRTRRRMNGDVSAWLSVVDGLPEVHRRLRRVVIENRPAVEFIQAEDTPGTLYYCDPPYMHETRASTDVYDFEMTDRQHEELLSVLKGCQGKVMLSGYPCPLYDRQLRDWSRHVFDLPNHAAGGKTKERKSEVVWCNF